MVKSLEIEHYTDETKHIDVDYGQRSLSIGHDTDDLDFNANLNFNVNVDFSASLYLKAKLDSNFAGVFSMAAFLDAVEGVGAGLDSPDGLRV